MDVTQAGLVFIEETKGQIAKSELVYVRKGSSKKVSHVLDSSIKDVTKILHLSIVH